MLFDPQKFRPPHFVLLLTVSAVVVQAAFKPASFIPSPFNWIGFVILLGGVVIMVEAHGLFNKKGTPVTHAETPTGVVTGGVYRFTRNPMYAAGSLIFLGIAVCVGTWPFFMSWALIGALLQCVFIPWEEKRMEELFGQEYLDYKSRTGRWL